jgi:hypothetical protein
MPTSGTRAVKALDEVADVGRTGTRLVDVPQSSIAARALGRRLASEHQVGEAGSILAGGASSTPLRAATRLADQYGGRADDWVKRSSSSYRGIDGHQFETHWYEDLGTGARVEFKTKFPTDSYLGYKGN